jgi:hypothetical protein
MKAADRAVLDAISSEVLRTDVVDAAIDRALDRLLSARLHREEERARLSARADAIDAELKRLTDVLAAGVGVGSITEASEWPQAERRRLYSELAALDALPPLDADDRARIRRELAELLDDWRGLLTQHVTQARQILRKLLTKRVGFVPDTRDGIRGYRLEGEGTLRPLLAAFVPQVVSPTGTDGVHEKESLVQGVASPICASWNQLSGWLQAVDGLRRAA